MVRRIAALIDVADVIGVIALALLAYGAGLLDPRLPFLVVGAALLLLAVAYGQPRQEPPAPPAPPEA